MARAAGFKQDESDKNMKTACFKNALVMGVTGWMFPLQLQAATIQTRGAGSAVSVVNHAATFNTLASTNTMELGNYKEGGLSITTGSQAWGADPPMAARLDPFHLPGGTDGGFSCSDN